MTRKHISWKTKCAAVLIAPCRNCGYALFLYDDAKKLTEDQLLSLLHWDHNILHESNHEDRDKYWNLTPMLIKDHREKTKTDAAIVAKSRRIRNKWPFYEVSATTGWKPQAQAKRKLRSRGFDKTKRRKMDGTVVKR